MQISEEYGDARYVIRAYEAGSVQINETRYTDSVLLTPQRLERDCLPSGAESLTDIHLQAIASLEPEIVILGTGRRFRQADAKVMAFFARMGIGLEVMDTGAACRTYNILMAEGRNVACALLLGRPEP